MPAEYEPHHGTLMIWPTRPGSWPFSKERLLKEHLLRLSDHSRSGKSLSLVEQDHLSEAQSYLGDKGCLFRYSYLMMPGARDTGPNPIPRQ